MDIHLLAGPVIGAVIGCFTNYIAVKMLFRPLQPIKIGSFTLPFTPGIIPRGKERLAKAVGNAVGENLLTEESFTETLLAPALEKRLKEKVRLFLYENRRNESTLRELLLEFIDEPLYETGLEKTAESLTERAVAKILEADIGGLIAEEAAKAVRERTRGGLISFVIGENMLELIRETIGDEVNLYLENHAEELLGPRVFEECERFMEMKVGALVGKIDDYGLPLDDILWNAYAAMVHKKLGSALRKLNISAMIEKKIDAMDMLEVEKLVLSVMKKELDAVVALGAVIGFALGLVNVFV